MSDDRITSKGAVEIDEHDLDRVAGGAPDGEFQDKDHKIVGGNRLQKVQPGDIRVQKV